MSDNDKQCIPPRDELFDDFWDLDTVVSATECTGLIPIPPTTEDEAESYTNIYAIPQPGVSYDDSLKQSKPND
ncbi:hypothetical protein [Hydrogenoanaerobacterium sp.]|uniref:hypothetical protein n=1 Tax=Hydrogenoanaerobacterium sp. TaxID=2953763 RepID=UPI002899C085|nr:hypothetical protein [Hydrogenoanaerobacterium sp.]